MANLIAETGHFLIVMESKSTMTPQSANAPDEGPPEGRLSPVFGKEAVEEIYPIIRAFIIGQLGWQIGEDVAHDAVGAILAGLPKVRAKTKRKFRAFCFRVARNKIFDALRSKYGNKAEPLDPIQLAKIIEAGMDASHMTPSALADLEDLQRLLKVLKFACGRLLVEFFLLDLEPDEIALVYDISKDAVRMKIHRCLKEAKRIAKKL